MARIIIEFSDNYLEERINASRSTVMDGTKEGVLMDLFNTTLIIGTKVELQNNNNEVTIKVSDIEALDSTGDQYQLIQNYLTKALTLPTLVATAKDKNIKIKQE